MGVSGAATVGMTANFRLGSSFEDYARGVQGPLWRAFYIVSDRRFKEYIPSSPLMGFGFFSCLD